MTVVANIDAAIEQHKAEIGQHDREIQIFGRVWPMVETLTTDVVDPLCKVIAAAEMVSDPNSDLPPMLGVQMISAVPEILPSVIREDLRAEFRQAWRKNGGIPIGVVTMVIEAVFTAFDALPFNTGVTTQPPNPAPQPASTTAPGNLSEAAGPTLSTNFNQQQPAMPPVAAIPQQSASSA